MIGTIVNAKSLLVKGKSHFVTHENGTLFKVVSGASGETYYVRMAQDDGRNRRFTCSCKWGTQGGYRLLDASGCSHAQAVNAYIALVVDGRAVSAWSDPEDAARQHRPVVDMGNGVYHTGRKVDDAEAKRKAATLERNRRVLRGDGFEL